METGDGKQIEYLSGEIRRLRHLLSIHTPPLEALLKRRGFRIYKKEIKDDLLTPGERFADSWYDMMKRYSFRLFLRDVIKQGGDFFTAKGIARYATAQVTGEYTEYLFQTGMLEKKGGDTYRLERRIKSFGVTLEWFLAETLRREFAAEAAWGVRFKRPLVGGDYDLVAKIDASILYMEVKSSPPKQIYQNEITEFLRRVDDLSPEIAVFFMDTELRMKDKIVPMFEEELRKKDPAGPMPLRFHKELFQIADRIFIINARDGVASNVEKVLARYFRRRGF